MKPAIFAEINRSIKNFSYTNLPIVCSFLTFSFSSKNKILLEKIILVFVCLYALYVCIGVVIGTFRGDEMLFFTDSWQYYKGFQSFYHVRPMFYDILCIYWRLSDSNLSKLWIFRLITSALIGVQYILISKLLSNLFDRKLHAKKIITIISFSIIVLLCAYRGFEVRTEIIPNTILIYSALTIVKNSRKKVFFTYDYVNIIICGFLLNIAATLSLRYFYISFLYYLIITLQIEEKINRIHKNFVILFLLFVYASFFCYLNLFRYNILEIIKISREVTLSLPEVGFMERLSDGAGRYFFFSRGLILLQILFFVLLKFRILSKCGFSVKTLNAFLLLISIISYLVFLYFFDKRPAEYIRSIELIIIFTYVAYMINYSYENEIRQFRLALFILPCLISLAVSWFSCIEILNRTRNSQQAIIGFFSSNFFSFEQLNDSEVVKLLLKQESIIDQSVSRHILCRRYPQSKAFVYTWEFHPICMQDFESFDFANSFGNFNFNNTNLSSIGYISFEKYEAKTFIEEYKNIIKMMDADSNMLRVNNSWLKE